MCCLEVWTVTNSVVLALHAIGMFCLAFTTDAIPYAFLGVFPAMVRWIEVWLVWSLKISIHTSRETQLNKNTIRSNFEIPQHQRSTPFVELPKPTTIKELQELQATRANTNNGK